MKNPMKLRNQLKTHEGMRDKAYKDSEGVLTIGVGHNLQANGLSPEVIEMILDEDINIATFDAKETLKNFNKLPEDVQIAMINMTFNLGRKRFSSFKKMIAAIDARDFKTASKEMLDSKWANQVGYRARELATMVLECNSPSK